MDQLTAHYEKALQTDSGREVLMDLLRMATRQVTGTTDPIYVAYCDGQRVLALEIIRKAGMKLTLERDADGRRDDAGRLRDDDNDRLESPVA